MSNGNINVGNAIRKPGQPLVERLSGSNDSLELQIDSSVKMERPGICGAMSQQGSDFGGNVSAPQKFVHLVGCRDPEAKLKARLGTELRQCPDPAKR